MTPKISENMWLTDGLSWYGIPQTILTGMTIPMQPDVSYKWNDVRSWVRIPAPTLTLSSIF